jgi:Smg protein
MERSRAFPAGGINVWHSRAACPMFEVLVYLFEKYYQNEVWSDQDALARSLTAAGFENEHIHDALDWLRGLGSPGEEPFPVEFDRRDSFRGWNNDELSKLATSSRGFIVFLESAGVLTPGLRELIIERAMAVEDATVELGKLKVIVLMVLWTRQGNVDTLVLEELLPEGGPRQIH